MLISYPIVLFDSQFISFALWSSNFSFASTINESFMNASNKVKAVSAEAKATAKRDESQVVGDNSAAQANSNSQNIPEAEPAQWIL